MVQKSSHKESEQSVREFEKRSEQGQQSQEKLRESEARFRTLFENGPEAMVVIDGETAKFVDANKNALRLFKLAREEFIGIGPLDISPPVQPDGRASKEVVQEKVQELLNENPKPFEWVHRDGSGRDFPCEIRHSKLPMSGRKFYCAIAIDITERRQTENEIKQYKRIVESTDPNCSGNIHLKRLWNSNIIDVLPERR
jgi:PAS domain S-box-containing protein